MSMTLMQEIKKTKNKLILTAMDLASARAWDDITMHEIADAAGVEHEIAQTIFRCKMDILITLNRQMDDELSDIYGDETMAENESQRDRLFDIIMERFDLLNENRTAYLSILNSVTMDPRAALPSLPFVYQSMVHMMTLAGMDDHGVKSSLHAMALSGLYLKTLRDWCKDDSADLAATMASLDKGLGMMDKMIFNKESE